MFGFIKSSKNSRLISEAIRVLCYLIQNIKLEYLSEMIEDKAFINIFITFLTEHDTLSDSHEVIMFTIYDLVNSSRYLDLHKKIFTLLEKINGIELIEYYSKNVKNEILSYHCNKIIAQYNQYLFYSQPLEIIK